MTLKAYFDDSGNDPTSGLFLFGGFVWDADQSAEFAHEWRDALARHSLTAFKWADAVKLVCGFKGWTEDARDRVVADLTCLVERRAMFRVRSSIWHSDFDLHIRSLPAPLRTLATDKPYFFLWYQAFTQTFVALVEAEMDGPVDFIFDTQPGYEAEFWWHWPRLEAILERYQDRLGMQMIQLKPSFGSDDLFPQLQAADLYVGAARHFLRTGIGSEALTALASVPEYPFEWTPEKLEKSRERLIADGKRILEANPGLQFKTYDEEAAKTVRKRDWRSWKHDEEA